MLNDETRLCFLNSIVNELRYPNSHTFSEKMYVLMYSNSSSRVRISFIGLLSVFFSMAQTPTTT